MLEGFPIHTPAEASQPIATHEERPALRVALLAKGKQLAELLLIVSWFGLVTGLAEASILAVKKFSLNKNINLSHHVAWMAPLADLFIFAILGFLLFLLAWRWPKLISPRIVAFVFAFLGFFSLLLMVPGLVSYAAFVLALGLAVQSARIIAARAEGFRRFARRTLGWLVAILAALAVGSYGWHGLTEQRALAKLPPPLPDAPNVLLIVLDTVRAESLSLHGYARSTTPQLERLAKTGVVFERAVSAASWTIPSHASMFTGRYLHELPDGWSNLTETDASFRTLAETLGAQGYLTAGFVANFAGCGYESGLNRGFTHYEDYPVGPGQIILSSSLGRTVTKTKLRRLISKGDLVNRKTAAAVNEDFLGWLSGKDQRPFFAFLNYFDAHAPYVVPEPFDVKFGPRPRPKALMKLSNYLDVLTTQGGAHSKEEDISQQQLQAVINAYDGAIAYVDHNLGLLFDELEKRGVLDNTLVIITSDHGEEFGEHGVFGHAYNLYWLPLHVPLLVSFPSRVPEGKIVREPVSLRDLAATVEDLLKLKDLAPFPGNSLARFWDGTDTSSIGDPPLSELGGHADDSQWSMKSLVSGKYHYIRNEDEREELYDIEKDPSEKQNIANSDEGIREVERFRMSLKTILAPNRPSH